MRRCAFLLPFCGSGVILLLWIGSSALVWCSTTPLAYARGVLRGMASGKRDIPIIECPFSLSANKQWPLFCARRPPNRRRGNDSGAGTVWPSAAACNRCRKSAPGLGPRRGLGPRMSRGLLLVRERLQVSMAPVRWVRSQPVSSKRNTFLPDPVISDSRPDFSGELYFAGMRCFCSTFRGGLATGSTGSGVMTAFALVTVTR